MKAPSVPSSIQIVLPDLTAEQAAVLIDVLDQVVRRLWDAHVDQLIDIYTERHEQRDADANEPEPRETDLDDHADVEDVDILF